MDMNTRNVPTRWDEGGMLFGLNNQSRCIKCGVKNLEPGKPVVCPDCVLKTKELQRGKF